VKESSLSKLADPAQPPKREPPATAHLSAMKQDAHHSWSQPLPVRQPEEQLPCSGRGSSATVVLAGKCSGRSDIG